MAVNVTTENNLLIIDDGVKKLYWNSAWVNMDFNNTQVLLSNQGKNDSQGQRGFIAIDLTDFEGDGVAITTEAGIATFLSDKIG